MLENIAIIGASSAIGQALIQTLSQRNPDASISAFSRTKPNTLPDNVRFFEIDYDDESSIEKAAASVSEDQRLDCVIVTNGILHDDKATPEKSLKDINAEQMAHIFHVNTITPMLIAKHFLPKLDKQKRSVFAALSARVGSISDNRLGGWYAYRASKAALNMLLKTASIEVGRFHNQAIVIGLHPGTVDSPLSKPFQENVGQDKLFTPTFSAEKLCDVIEKATTSDSGQCFAWDGQLIAP